ncbi:MAG: hypothetical protein H6718_36095 [Polyangiaceae bacterium]|nr:hypothetical protein [Myxococcales bacterium]MCB9590883.1 hypothetical protein [Polyangiaceae bacterium]
MAHIPTTHSSSHLESPCCRLLGARAVSATSHASGSAELHAVFVGGLSGFDRAGMLTLSRRPSYASLCVWPVSL